MDSPQQPISSLAPQGGDAMKSAECSHYHQGGYYGGSFATWILWFIIVTVIIWLILFSTKPTWVQKTDYHGNYNGEVDGGKALLWAVVIALIICIIIWIIWGWGWGYGQGEGRY